MARKNELTFLAFAVGLVAGASWYGYEDLSRQLPIAEQEAYPGFSDQPPSSAIGNRPINLII